MYSLVTCKWIEWIWLIVNILIEKLKATLISVGHSLLQLFKLFIHKYWCAKLLILIEWKKLPHIKTILEVLFIVNSVRSIIPFLKTFQQVVFFHFLGKYDDRCKKWLLCTVDDAMMTWQFIRVLGDWGATSPLEVRSFRGLRGRLERKELSSVRTIERQIWMENDRNEWRISVHSVEVQQLRCTEVDQCWGLVWFLEQVKDRFRQVISGKLYL